MGQEVLRGMSMMLNSNSNLKLLLFVLSLALSLGLSGNSAYAGPSGAMGGDGGEYSSVKVQTLKTHSRLSFRVDDGVESRWTETKDGFEIFFKGIGLTDLGAAFGHEADWVAQEGQVADQRLAHLKYEEVAGGLKVIGKWKFPSGDQAPVNPGMEHFTYREKNPPRYVVDYWPQKSLTVAEARAAKKQANRLALLKRAEEQAKKRRDRRLASAQNKQEAEEITQFCRQPLSEKKDIFLPFQAVHEKFDLKKWISTTTPDSDYIYLEPKTKERDAQYVRLALKLYRQGKAGLVIRTLDFLDAEFPNSSFQTEMKFLRANAMLKLGHEAETLRLLNDLMVNSRESGVALHAGMFIAARHAEKGTHLSALESFLWLINNHPHHRMTWVFHMGAAESLYELKQAERAAKEYKWVMTQAPDKKAQAEGASRVGDLYLGRMQYESALASYFQAINYFKDELKVFPNVFVNRAESLYWLGQYDRAEKEFHEFLKIYPTHPSGWRAAYRIAEIHGRRSELKQARHWFYETINRYPFSPGATLARLQLLPCGNHGGFDLESAQAFYAGEAAKFTGDDELHMERYTDFKGLSQVRALITLGREDLAVKVAINELQSNARSEARYIVGDLLRTLFRKSILDMVAEGKHYEALSFYNQHHEAIPRPPKGKPDPIDPDYLMKLSQASATLGLGTVSRNFMAQYRGVQKLPGAERVPAAHKSSDKNPDATIDERLKWAEESFTEAKALWIESGAKENSRIRELLQGVIEESEFSFERELLLGLLDESEEKNASALGHAVKAQLLRPKLNDPRLDYWVASLHGKAGDTRTAISIIRKLQKAESLTGNSEQELFRGVPSVPSREALVMAEGELLGKLGKWGEASGAYAKLVDEGAGGNQALYEYARTLEKAGGELNLSKATAALRKIAGSEKDDFWRKLAREALAAKGDNSFETK